MPSDTNVASDLLQHLATADPAVHAETTSPPERLPSTKFESFSSVVFASSAIPVALSKGVHVTKGNDDDSNSLVSYDDSVSTTKSLKSTREKIFYAVGKRVVFVGPSSQTSTVCRAVVGANGSKWCFGKNCTVASHQKARESCKLMDDNGLFMMDSRKSSSELAFCSPWVPSSQLDVHSTLFEELLECDDPDVNMIDVFGEIRSTSEKFDSLEEVVASMNARRMLSQDFKTPKNDNRKGFSQFKDEKKESGTYGVMKMLKSTMARVTSLSVALGNEKLLNVPGTSKPNDVVNVLLSLQESVNAEEKRTNALEEALEALDDDHENLVSMMDWNKCRDATWKVMVKLTREVVDLKRKFKQTLSKSGKSTKESDGIPNDPTLRKSMSDSDDDEDIVIASPSGSSGGKRDKGSVVEINTDTMLILMKRVSILEGKKGTSKGVTINGFFFGGEDDVEAWCEEHMGGVFHVGCITDCYNYMNRIKDGSTGNQDIKYLVDLDRVHAAGDYATSMKAYMTQMPKMCGNPTTASAFKTAHRSYLPAIPSYKVWDNPKTRSGIRYILKSNAMNVTAQIADNIYSKLGSYPVARSFALSLLHTTREFVGALSAYMTETHDNLVEHGYTPDLAWSIVTQVVHHMFTVDMDKERSFVREQMNTRSQKKTAVAIMWGCLKTHRVMEEYSRYGIENHPSVAAQYVKFLVQNRVDETMKKTVDDALHTAEEAKSMAASVSNGLDQLEREESIEDDGASMDS